MSDPSGSKVCSACRKVLPVYDFTRDYERNDGRMYICRKCRNERDRQRYVRIPRRGGPRTPDRDGDKRQARGRVNGLIQSGRLPRPGTLPCTDCGHVHRASERRHEYDHVAGYGVGAHLLVEAVCTKCHRQRERARRLSSRPTRSAEVGA